MTGHGSRLAENCGGLRSCSTWGGGDAGSLLPGVLPPTCSCVHVDRDMFAIPSSAPPPPPPHPTPTQPNPTQPPSHLLPPTSPSLPTHTHPCRRARRGATGPAACRVRAASSGSAAHRGTDRGCRVGVTDSRCSCAADGGPTNGVARGPRLPRSRAGYQSAQGFDAIPLPSHGSFRAADGGTVGGSPDDRVLLFSIEVVRQPVEQTVGGGGGGGLPGFLPGQSYSFTAEQIIDNPVPRRGLGGGLHGLHPGQSSTAFGEADHRIPAAIAEQIVDIPVLRGAPHDFHQDPLSAAGSSDLPDTANQAVFVLFPG